MDLRRFGCSFSLHLNSYLHRFATCPMEEWIMTIEKRKEGNKQSIDVLQRNRSVM